MITRIEIDGFKSFLDFKLDVPPFLALVGPNASGKSNLFDALRLVADVVEHGADQALRSQARGGARDLFHRSTDGGEVDRLTIVVGMVVASPFGPLAMRCRLRLKLIGGQPSFEECVAWVSSLKDRGWLKRAGATPAIIDALTRARSGYLDSGAPSEIGVDGRPRGKILLGSQWEDLPGPSDDILASLPTIWGLLSRECQGWRILGLEPTQMRKGAAAPDDEPLDPLGRNLAAVLYRLARREALWQVEADLATLVPGPTQIASFLDERRQEYDFDVVFKNTGRVPPRLLSDGTLRALALCAAARDPDFPGVLLIEEVENGLHPGRVAELVRRLVRNLPDERGAALLEPQSQVIVTSHSPTLVAALRSDHSESLVFTEAVTHIDTTRHARSQITRALPVAESGEPGTFTSPWDVERFLSSVKDLGT